MQDKVQNDAFLAEIARRIAAETDGFTGGPSESFAMIGRYTLESLQRCGLKRSSNVLDMGCGALRNGYWLIRYLDSGRYFGIDPSRRYVQLGLKYAFSPELLDEKEPSFVYNEDFDVSKFGVKFDFVLARSIFSHASPRLIGKAFDCFRDNAAPGGIMLASYNRMPKGSAKEVVDLMQRGEWSWRRYSTSYLQALASEHGLEAQDFGKPFHGQVWLKVTEP